MNAELEQMRQAGYAAFGMLKTLYELGYIPEHHRAHACTVIAMWPVQTWPSPTEAAHDAGAAASDEYHPLVHDDHVNLSLDWDMSKPF